MKAIALTVILLIVTLTSGQPPQPWIIYNGYWYVLYKGPHPPNVQQPGVRSPAVLNPVPVRVSVLDNRQTKSLQAGPQVKQYPVKPTAVAAPPAASAKPQAPGFQRQQAPSASVLRQQYGQQAPPPMPSLSQPPPAQPQQTTGQIRSAKSNLPRRPAPSQQPVPPSQPAQPPPARFGPPPVKPPQPVRNQPSPPNQAAPPALGTWNPVPMWNPVPPLPISGPPANPVVQQYLSPGQMGTVQVQYPNRLQPAPNSFHPGPAQMHPGAHGAHMGSPHAGYLPLEPPDIDLPLTPCGESIPPPTTASILPGLPAAPNPDPRCRCEDPQDCDMPGTTVDPVCPAWTTCCCRPLPPTVPPAPTAAAAPAPP
ncbi:uncharacterized protein LOC135466954 [Liolophura sinensis]|uniref:uncharacterized protein LOC135466954 n=1 Tax=Liolophura sinensis TaxID=3198878 RepID=UPI0031595E45